MYTLLSRYWHFLAGFRLKPVHHTRFESPSPAVLFSCGLTYHLLSCALPSPKSLDSSF